MFMNPRRSPSRARFPFLSCFRSYGGNADLIDNLAKFFSPVQFQLVSIEMNSMADSLANLGIQRSKTFKAWW
ncbi:hypothetical protein GQ457_02G037910 [Hibiscus cannabinus]